MHWVTQCGIKISRAATACLIRRFIDQDATFVFVSAAKVAETACALGGVGFHAPVSSAARSRWSKATI
ncbi:MAG TPA: chromate resistance protein ChrB domain-containing protein [Gemmatimonadaceae bacterium]|nr:chromate resistance protein ChrB domain-containing protein [Gemmatimonadaceae bacterium]